MKLGGGIIFGFKFCMYNFVMNCKECCLVLCIVLMVCIEDVIVVKDFGVLLEVFKICEIIDVLGCFGVVVGFKVFIVLMNFFDVVCCFVCNLEKVKLIFVD